MEKTKIMVCMKKKKFHLIFLFFLSSNPVIREFGRKKKNIDMFDVQWWKFLMNFFFRWFFSFHSFSFFFFCMRQIESKSHIQTYTHQHWNRVYVCKQISGLYHQTTRIYKLIMMMMIIKAFLLLSHSKSA